MLLRARVRELRASQTSKAGKLKTRVKTSQDTALGKRRNSLFETGVNQKNLEGLPPGLAKHEELLPGLQRQLKKNGTLPPGLQKRIQPLPKDLESSLPELPTGLRRGVLGDLLVLIEENSEKIIDIVADIF